ncbi:MAG TPA: glycosyltransferase family 2 protein [Elusimicrobiales bacterium]|nr:glycosyltransferase family 2 protein [Elusimicrobiales bacterium]
MRISVITACYNSVATLADTLDSVSAQAFDGLEHIVVDGGSTDNTLEIVKTHGKKISRVISGPDKGIYDALNKGIAAATGEVVGIMHSDDVYAGPEVLGKVAELLKATGADACYGDLVYVEREDISRIVRYWRSGPFEPEWFRRGWMPPHPAFFLRKSVYEKYGLYDLAYPLASDYELMLRMLYRYRVSCVYLPEVLVKMRRGGTSRAGVFNTVRMLRENHRAWKINGLTPSLSTFLLKPLSKLGQYAFRP